MKMKKRLRAFACVALVCLGTCARAAQNDARAVSAMHGGSVPIPPDDAIAIEDLINDQGALHFVITYPAQKGMAARRAGFTHIEDHATVNGTACTIVTRVARQRENVPAAHYRSVFALGDVGHMQIVQLSALASLRAGRSAETNASMPPSSVEPDIPVVVLQERGDLQEGIFMFGSIEPARRFLAILQRVVPRCGGRND